jgi:hypothetical protein
VAQDFIQVTLTGFVVDVEVALLVLVEGHRVAIGQGHGDGVLAYGLGRAG